MQSLEEAVAAVSLRHDGRPLKWCEWRQLLGQLGDTLSDSELARLERHLTAAATTRGTGYSAGQPSMHALLEAVAEQHRCDQLRQRTVQWRLDERQCAELRPCDQSAAGLAVIAQPASDLSGTRCWQQLPAVHCTRHVLHVTAPNTACRIQLFVDSADDSDHQQQHQEQQQNGEREGEDELNRSAPAGPSHSSPLLLLLHHADDTERPVCVARWHTGTGSYIIDACLARGRYTLTPLLLPAAAADAGNVVAADQSSGHATPQLVTVQADTGSVQLSAAYRHVLSRLFRALDWQRAGSLSRCQFSALNELTAGESVSDSEWQIVLDHFSTTPQGRLTETGFEQLHRLEAEDRADQLHELWTSLHAVGFDAQLLPTGLVSYRLQLLCNTVTPTGEHEQQQQQLVMLPCEELQLVHLSQADVCRQLQLLSAAGDCPAAGWRLLALDTCTLLLFANVAVAQTDGGDSGGGGGATVCATVDHSGAANCRAVLPGRARVAAGGCAVVQCLVRVDAGRPWTPAVTVATEAVADS